LEIRGAKLADFQDPFGHETNKCIYGVDQPRPPSSLGWQHCIHATFARVQFMVPDHM
jgi:hypothetical protein